MNALLVLPIPAIIASLIYAYYRTAKKGKSVKSSLIMNGAAFAFVMLLCFAFPYVSSAAETAEGTVAAASALSDTAKGMGFIAMAISTGLASLGAGIAVSGASSAAIGATVEDPKAFGKSLIFVALGEGVAIYGILISIIIFSKL